MKKSNNNYLKDTLTSRFFKQNDEYTQDFFFRLNESWWSRKYEYLWASKFIDENDTALDAACGVSHPFKFYLAEKNNNTHAIDLDKRINSYQDICKEIKNDLGASSLTRLSKSIYDKINFQVSDLTSLPFESNYFDKIYCISVLEHLNDDLNNSGRFASVFYRWRINNPKVNKDMYLALKEFSRVLKPNGKIILTFDYPRINLRYFSKAIEDIGLKPVGCIDYRLPSDALFQSEIKLYCFRVVLEKSN